MQAAYAKFAAQDNEQRAPRQQFDRMLAFVESQEALAMPHDEVEQWLGREGRELQRRLLQYSTWSTCSSNSALRTSWFQGNAFRHRNQSKHS
jgi:hypothetical protein